MKVVLVGNICSGKSTIAQLLLKRYNKAEYISIDGTRKLYGDGSNEMEAICKEKFLEMIDLNAKFQVIELTGVGILGKRFFSLLSNYKHPILVFHLIVPPKILLERAKKKVWDIPFPIDKKNIPTAIEYTEMQFSEGLAYNLIAKHDNAVLVSLHNNNNNLLQNNLNIIFALIESCLHFAKCDV